ncbi:MAG: hypothetical protein AAF799_29985 [Myxococcota bacterium]
MSFGRHLEQFLGHLAGGGSMTLVRYGDGERCIMQGAEISTMGTNRHWCWRPSLGISSPRITEDLAATLAVDRPGYYVGISCPCCNEPDHRFYMDRLPAARRRSRVTYANLFSNGNYPALAEGFVPALRAAGRPVVLVSNWDRDYDRARQVLAGLEVFAVPLSAREFDEPIPNPVGEGFYRGGAVLWYSQHRDEVRARARAVAREHAGAIVLVQLGPVANIIVAEMFDERPEGTYLDMGHALDLLLYGETSRTYMVGAAAMCRDMDVDWVF